MIQDHI